VELEKKGSKLEKKDSEFQAAFQGLNLRISLPKVTKLNSIVHPTLNS